MALSNFPGVIAQEVSPNPKCNNCLHFEGNRGTVGLCVIGLRPWLCGDGDNQIAGFSPLDGQKPTEPGNVAASGQANAGVDTLQVVPMSLTVLGDEHAVMTKSIHDELDAIQKKVCPLHQNTTTMKSYSQSVGVQVCKCKRIASKAIATKLFKALENKERVHVNEDDVLFFVRGIRQGMEPFDIALARLRDGVTSDDMNKSLSVEKRVNLGDNNALAKSLYGEDWTSQFLGTDLFDEAAKLRGREIENCEAELKARIERNKKDKERRAQQAKMEPDTDWEKRYAEEEALRIAKAKLMLKLQKHRNKQMSPKGK